MFGVIPFGYIARNLVARVTTTALTAGGMALVVFVFTVVLMMAEGLSEAMVGTGRIDNVVLIRRSSQTEVQSALSRSEVAVIKSLVDVPVDGQGQALLSEESVVLINLKKNGNGNLANVVVRGVAQNVTQMRPQARLVSGRMFRGGTSEIVVGHNVAKGFQGVSVGKTLHFALRDWLVVGEFDAGGTAYDSEIWGDCDQTMQAFRRNAFSSMLLRLPAVRALEDFKSHLENDPRIMVEVKRESQFYADQSEQMVQFIKVLGLFITVIFSIGAMIGATITMYASVANRVGEIGTLRALGFTRSNVLVAFLVEAIALGAAGGVAGLALAATTSYFQVSTTNIRTFSEISFHLRMTPFIALQAILFACAMGFLGGFIPALRAARLEIVDALRS